MQSDGVDLYQARGFIPRSTFQYFTKHFAIGNTWKNNWQHDPIQLSSTVLRDAQDTEDVDEEVDEIEIEANRSHNVLVRGEATVDEVRIIDDISTEY